jgi:hypothetical protein
LDDGLDADWIENKWILNGWMLIGWISIHWEPWPEASKNPCRHLGCPVPCKGSK